MNVLNAVAQFERDLLIERTQAGLMRAKEAGKKLGRPSSLSDEEKQGVLNALAAGESVSAVAKRWGTSRQTVMRVRSAAGHNQQTLCLSDFPVPLLPAPPESNLLTCFNFRILKQPHPERNGLIKTTAKTKNELQMKYIFDIVYMPPLSCD